MLNYAKNNAERLAKVAELVGNKIEIITDVRLDEAYYDVKDQEYKVKGIAKGLKRKYVRDSNGECIDEYDDIVSVEFNNIDKGE